MVSLSGSGHKPELTALPQSKIQNPKSKIQEGEAHEPGGPGQPGQGVEVGLQRVEQAPLRWVTSWGRQPGPGSHGRAEQGQEAQTDSHADGTVGHQPRCDVEQQGVRAPTALTPGECHGAIVAEAISSV